MALFSGSRALACAFQREYPHSSIIEIESSDIIHLAPSATTPGYYTVGISKTLLPFPKWKIRDLQIEVNVGWDDMDSTKCLRKLSSLLRRLHRKFPALRKLIVKIVWLDPFGPSTTEGEYRRFLRRDFRGGMGDLVDRLLLLFLNLHGAQVADKFLILGPNGTSIDIHEMSMHSCMNAIQTQVSMPKNWLMEFCLRTRIESLEDKEVIWASRKNQKDACTTA